MALDPIMVHGQRGDRQRRIAAAMQYSKMIQFGRHELPGDGQSEQEYGCHCQHRPGPTPTMSKPACRTRPGHGRGFITRSRMSRGAGQSRRLVGKGGAIVRRADVRAARASIARVGAERALQQPGEIGPDAPGHQALGHFVRGAGAFHRVLGQHAVQEVDQSFAKFRPSLSDGRDGRLLVAQHFVERGLRVVEWRPASQQVVEGTAQAIQVRAC